MKLSRVLSILLLFSLILAACASDQSGEQGANSAYPGLENSNTGFGNDNTGFGNDNSGFSNDNSGFSNDNSGLGNDNSGLGNDNSGLGNTNSSAGNTNGGVLPNTGGTAMPTTSAGGTAMPTTEAGGMSTPLATTTTGGALSTPQATTSGGGMATPLATTTTSGGQGAPMTTQTPQGGQALPNTGMPQQSQAATIIGDRNQLVRLSQVMGFNVTTQDGQQLGTVNDFIVNTCETFIVYMVVSPSGAGSAGSMGNTNSSAGNTNSGGMDNTNASAGNTNASGGAQGQGQAFIVPFEAVTINSGAWDVSNRALVINVPAQAVSQAPRVQAGVDLSQSDWESSARSFWGQQMRVSNLNTECAAESGRVRKIAYASHLLNAELRDGNDQLLGRVVEAVLEPESGSIDFFVVQLEGQDGYVLVPLGAVNIPEEAMGAGQTVWLVLLEDTSMLMGAPTITSLDMLSDFQNQTDARSYWNVPAAPGGPIPSTGNTNGSGTGNGNGNANDNDSGGGYTQP